MPNSIDPNKTAPKEAGWSGPWFAVPQQFFG